MSIVQLEIQCQYKALQILSGHDDKKVASIVSYNSQIIPATFRKIITDYEQKFNRVPDCLELIKTCSNMLNLNLYKIA